MSTLSGEGIFITKRRIRFIKCDQLVICVLVVLHWVVPTFWGGGGGGGGGGPSVGSRVP